MLHFYPVKIDIFGPWLTISIFLLDVLIVSYVKDVVIEMTKNDLSSATSATSLITLIVWILL